MVYGVKYRFNQVMKKYLIFLILKKSKGTTSHKYNVNNDFIEIIKLNGGSSEYNYYLSEDTLIIQRLENGKFIINKYLKEKLTL